MKVNNYAFFRKHLIPNDLKVNIIHFSVIAND